MCEYGACRGAGQLLGPSNPRVESLVESKRWEAKTASPTLTPPGGFGCGVPTESTTASPTNANREPVALTALCHWKDWENHLEGHRQWALTKQKVCGTVLWVAEAGRAQGS